AGSLSAVSHPVVWEAEGCSRDLDHPAAFDVHYVWLAPREHLTDAYIESNAVRDHPVRLGQLSATRAAYLRQAHAWSHAWEKAALEDLVTSIAPHAPGIAELIRHWIES